LIIASPTNEERLSTRKPYAVAKVRFLLALLDYREAYTFHVRRILFNHESETGENL